MLFRYSLLMVQFLQGLLLLFWVVEASSDNGFPPMYQMENYKNCPKNTSTYCLFTFKVTPQSGDSRLTQILNTRNRARKFDRTELNRMLCIPNSIAPADYGKNAIEAELHGLNITSELKEIQCEQQWDFMYEKTIVWLIIASYLAITLEATRRHYMTLKDPKAPKASTWCSTFSVITNAEKLCQENLSMDFQRLKSVQGIRVFNMGIVVAWHCVVSLSQTYITNVEELEKNFEEPWFYYLMFLGGLCVQMFFLISSFLLTNQICHMFSKNRRFSLHDCCIMMLNRIFRLLPVLLFSIFTTWMGIYDNSPHTIANKNVYIPACQCTWWHTLLQTTFLVPFHQICTPGMWYLSVDTLYYGGTLLLLYVVLNFGLDLRRLAARLILILIVCFAVYLHMNEYSFMFRPYPQNLKYMAFSKDMEGVYIPPLASWPSSLFGVILGHIYYCNKFNKRIKEIGPDQEKLWWLTFAGIPLLALHLTTCTFTGITASIMGAILKPLFVFPLGLGVLGMAFGLGGPVKTFLESRILLILSNVTFCTYVYHFYVVFAKAIFLNELLPYHSDDITSWLTFDLVAAFSLGTLMTILVEFPFLTLQKIYLPQVKPAANKQA